MSVTIVIPARMGSTRLQEKALADIGGKPMIQHVYERAKKVRGVDEIIVATDHDRIIQAVEKFGGKAVMTPDTLQSGTDRVAYVAKTKHSKIFINVQGDEPMLNIGAVEKSLELVQSGKFPMATPGAPIRDKDALQNPNVVKVLVDVNGRAVYFSRHPIPYSKGPVPENPQEISPLHHMGIYVYTRETLLRFMEAPRSPWEMAENLEQLRALYHGVPIGVAKTDHATHEVNTQEDLELVRRALLG